LKTDKLNIVCFPGVLYDKEPYTNRQRVMGELQKRGHNIIFVEPLKNPITQLLKALLGVSKEQKNLRWFSRILGLEQRHEHLWISSTVKWFSIKNKKVRKVAHYINGILLNEKLRKMGIKDPIVWIYTPDAVDFTNWVQHSLLIYDCVDEYAAQPWYKDQFKGIRENENELLKKADIVFTSAEALYTSKKQKNPHTYLLENVAEFDHFNKVITDTVDIPEEISSLKGPVIGFIGAIDKYKLDISSVINMANLKKEWNIVLIGPHGQSEKAVNLDEIVKLPNVHILGPKKYDDLPSYIKGFDVCVIPYNENEYTVGCFPLKFFEYLATGKPVVTLGLPSLKKFIDYNVYARDFNEYIRLIESHLLHDNEDEKARRVVLASSNTWSSKVDKMESIINISGMGS
jgi:glycosyltransferase involved in cell wall biosynthesis